MGAFRNLFVFVVALFFVGPTGLVAKTQPPEKLNPVIMQAHAQLLARERMKAVEILLTELAAVRTNATMRTELLKELNRAANLFFTNEGQKAYELAESIRLSGQTGYQPKYDAALLAEGPQLQILTGQALGFLSAKNCKAAKVASEAAEKLNPYFAGAKILNFKARLCSSDVDWLPEEMSSLEGLSEGKAYVLLLFAQKSFIMGKNEEALKYVREAMREDPSYTSPYYWGWKILSVEENAGLDEAQSFLGLCKTVNSSLRRKYYLEPDVCVLTEQVEEFIKKIEGANL